MLTVTITTAERVVYESTHALSITIPTVNGEITILPNHIDLMTIVGIGEALIKDEKGTTNLYVDGGLLQVNKNSVEILTNTAERAEDLDQAKIEEAKRRAEKLLTEKPIDVDLVQVEASLRKELTKQKILTKYRPR
ncbi:ATP synthase F1 subunit epsilon [Candidatus Woesebacteria bacterium]|nr:MAG: ATP synthase F1 subunit epsilon [Candidatus Woesebacteria bacterium]